MAGGSRVLEKKSDTLLTIYQIRMKFGEAFTEYLHGEQEQFLHNYSHVGYKRLKKVLKTCRVCRVEDTEGAEHEDNNELPQIFRCDSCPLCDQKFFTELTREASEIAGCFSSRVRRLHHLHVPSPLQRFMWRLRYCFMDDQQLLIQEGRMLLDYVVMNAIAIRKILKKYDKVHSSVNGRNFKTKMRAENIELLQSPWLIELGAFYLNISGSEMGEPGEFFRIFSCDLTGSQPVMTMTLSDSVKYEYNLTCAICLETVFNPYALSCGHLFCKTCACCAASVQLFQGLKAAPREAKCPSCRTAGVYSDSVHMTELDLLLKTRCKEYWKERLCDERAQMAKESKEYRNSQKISAMRY